MDRVEGEDGVLGVDPVLLSAGNNGHKHNRYKQSLVSSQKLCINFRFPEDI